MLFNYIRVVENSMFRKSVPNLTHTIVPTYGVPQDLNGIWQAVNNS